MTQGSYVDVNGLSVYYETHGTGKPLVLLHGGLSTIDTLGQLLPDLAETRRVIAVELQAHGHTADVERPLSFALMADDVAALIEQLGFASADLLGYSLGGGVALQTTIRHPDVVRRLVLVSTPYKRDGWFPADRAGMTSINAEALVGSPIHEVYVRTAPRPEDWPVLVAKTRNLLSEDYDWSADVAAIKAPTMIVVGDADAVRPAHALQFFELLGGGQVSASWDGSGMSNSRLAILPGTTHYTSLSSPLLPAMLTSFLDASLPEAR